MELYTAETRAENPLYESVMEDINELYEEMNEPDEFADDETRRTTTGNQTAPYWNSHEIGDWDGDEENVADEAQEQLNAVYEGLGLGGNGGISHYYRTAEWAEFVESAKKIIDDYHATDAFTALCEMDI